MNHPLAQELNQALAGTAAEKLLSAFGKRMFFPKGIISQSAEAGEKGKLYNATIGVANLSGKPVILDAVQAELPHLSPGEAVGYAPTAGVPALRKQWLAEMCRKNPGLDAGALSLPAVVPGLTPGVTYAMELFLDPGQAVVSPDMFWENYTLIIEERLGAKMAGFNAFTPAGGFDVASFEKALAANVKDGKVAFILNFPNNPAGYSPTKTEAVAIAAVVKRLADSGVKVAAITDDAYFGLFYEDDVETESLFSKFASLSPNVLAVKIDGPTKEDYVWGFRTGFVTFGCKGMSAPQYEALVKKLMGAIRSSVSSSSGAAQYILLKASQAPGYAENKARMREMMHGRYKAVRAALAGLSCVKLRPRPFNSGYFMCFECLGFDAEALRQRLLAEGIGTIALDSKTLRVAFSSVDTDKIADCYARIYKAAEAM
jgi:aspartate/methionine/tyrosine aminotransferase